MAHSPCPRVRCGRRWLLPFVITSAAAVGACGRGRGARLSFPWGARPGEELPVRGRLHVQLCGEAARRLLPAVRAGPVSPHPRPHAPPGFLVPTIPGGAGWRLTVRLTVLSRTVANLCDQGHSEGPRRRAGGRLPCPERRLCRPGRWPAVRGHLHTAGPAPRARGGWRLACARETQG